jgi:hypothetical protein
MERPLGKFEFIIIYSLLKTERNECNCIMDDGSK